MSINYTIDGSQVCAMYATFGGPRESGLGDSVKDAFLSLIKGRFPTVEELKPFELKWLEIEPESTRTITLEHCAQAFKLWNEKYDDGENGPFDETHIGSAAYLFRCLDQTQQ